MRFNDLEIRPPKKSDSVLAYLDFINALIDENAYILINKKPTFKEQKKWVNERLENAKQKREIFLGVWDGSRHVGNCIAAKDRWKEEENIHVGLALSKDYRGRGLGEFLLRETILLAKKNFKPRNIYLRMFSDNKIAKRLYQKVGFRKIAHFPEWTYHNGKYVGHDYMLLKEWSE